MVDLDYGKLQIYNGNYDFFMVESALSKQLLTNENAKKEAKIKELESFVRALGVDMIAPEGFGEIVGGGQREDDLKILEKRIEEHGLDRKDFE